MLLPVSPLPKHGPPCPLRGDSHQHRSGHRTPSCWARQGGKTHVTSARSWCLRFGREIGGMVSYLSSWRCCLIRSFLRWRSEHVPGFGSFEFSGLLRVYEFNWFVTCIGRLRSTSKKWIFLHQLALLDALNAFFFGLFDSVDKSYDILTPVSYDRIYHISSAILYIQSRFKDSQLDLSMPNLQLWRFPPRFASADFESDGNFNFEDTELWKLWWCFRIWCKEVGSSWFASLEHVELRNLQWLHFFSALSYHSLQFAMQWMFFLQVRCEEITGKYWFSANGGLHVI